MFSSRRPLAIAIALVMLFAMLAPAAMAAPKGPQSLIWPVVSFTPTTAAPAYVNPEKCNRQHESYDHRTDSERDQEDKDHHKCTDPAVTIVYTLNITNTQVDTIHVDFRLLKEGLVEKNIVLDDETKIYPNDPTLMALPPTGGAATFTQTLVVKDDRLDDRYEMGRQFKEKDGEIPDGFYNLQVCARNEANPGGTTQGCVTNLSAVVVQDSWPTADLEKPGNESNRWGNQDWHGEDHLTWVTGNQYLLVGSGTDDFGIVQADFWYCDESNSRKECDRDSSSWIKIATGTPSAPGIWMATWNSSLVPDDFAEIRLCVTNHVGLSNCSLRSQMLPDWKDHTRMDSHEVYVSNHHTVDLQPGWNLVSSPLMLYNNNIANVFSAVDCVSKVYAYDPSQPVATQWSFWVPPALVTATNPQGTLTKFYDGKGYWVLTNSPPGCYEDSLTFVGTWNQTGPSGPPQYNVYPSWNLIGYTQWGRPPILEGKDGSDYLGPSIAPYVNALWYYNAGTEKWSQLDPSEDHMKVGFGYWLANAVTLPAGAFFNP